MDANELMIPRYEVISEYPGSYLKPGTVLTQTVTDYYRYKINGINLNTKIENIEKYPHIFRRMN